MPRWAQVLTWLNPPRYFIEMLRGVYLQGSTLADLGTQLLALLGFDAFFGTWAVLSAIGRRLEDMDKFAAVEFCLYICTV